MNEKKSDTPTPSNVTGKIELSEVLTAIGRAFLLGSAFRPPSPAPSRCDWLLERYPEEFVRALMEGGHCDLRSRAETLPTLDSYPWGWIEFVQTAYAMYASHIEITGAMRNMSQALQEFANAEVPRGGAQREKEYDAKRERKTLRAEQRKDQPWRKQHR